MGVRFECPAGHKLHVKAELAGKRGICPECGAKFVVPRFSGQRVPVDDGVTTTSTIAAVAPPSLPGRGAVPCPSLPPGVPTAAPIVPGAPIPTAPPARPSTAASPAPAEPTAWYIRPAAGGQFGPASDEVFRQWVAEGRVAADSWVWRTGWPDWKGGAEALAIGISPAPSFAGAEPIADALFDFDEDDATIAADFSTAAIPMVDAATTASRGAEIQRRKKQVRNFAILLTVVALAMFVTLVVVLTRKPAESPPDGGSETTPAQEAGEAPASEAAPAAEEPAAPAGAENAGT